MTDLIVAEAHIRQLQARYTDAVWRHDYAAFANCFTEDGEWRISGMVLRGRTQIEATITRILDNFHRVLISFGTPILTVGNATAQGRTYVTEKCAWKSGERSVSIGRYYERYVEDGSEWRFAWRLFQLHYRGPADLSGEYFDNPDFGAPPGMPDLNEATTNHAVSRWKLQQ